ncbi:hypothetical protein ACGE24_07330 [Corynebacterium kroppenstedtii]
MDLQTVLEQVARYAPKNPLVFLQGSWDFSDFAARLYNYVPDLHPFIH